MQKCYDISYWYKKPVHFRLTIGVIKIRVDITVGAIAIRIGITIGDITVGAISIRIGITIGAETRLSAMLTGGKGWGVE